MKTILTSAVIILLALLLPAAAYPGEVIWAGRGGDFWNTNSSPYSFSTSSSYFFQWAVSATEDGGIDRKSGVCLADCGASATPYIFGSTGWGGNRPYRRSRADGSYTGWTAQEGRNDSGTGFRIAISPDARYIVHLDINGEETEGPNIRCYLTDENPAGSPIWSAFIDDAEYLGIKFGPDGRIYGGGKLTSCLFALDPTDGTTVWTADDDVLSWMPGAFCDNGTTLMYVVAGDTSTIAAYDTQTNPGTLIWDYDDSEGGKAGPTIDPNTGTVYSFRRTRPIALSSTGALQWEGDSVVDPGFETVRSMGALSRDGSTFYIQTGTPYTGVETMPWGGLLYAYNTSDGSMKWSRQIESKDAGVWTGGPVVSENGIIFVHNANTLNGTYAGEARVMAIKDETTTSTLLWEIPMYAQSDQSGGWIAIGPGTIYFDGQDAGGNAKIWAVRGTDTPLMIETTSVPGPKMGSMYSFSMSAIGGQLPYTWSQVGLLPGLDIDPSTGEISGTASSAGAFLFTVSVSDSGTPSAQDSRQFELIVTGSEIVPWPTPALGRVGVPFTAEITTDLDAPPYSWALANGSYPPGVGDDSSTTKTLTLGGTPTQTGSSTFTVMSADNFGYVDLEDFQVNIQQMEIAETAPPVGGVDFWYTFTPEVLGGFPSYNWSVSDGSLPPGLTIDPSTGTISGTSTTAGTYAFELTAVDSGSPQNIASGEFTIVISYYPLDIVTLSVKSGTLGQPYPVTRFEYMASNSDPVTWSMPSGSLPVGLSLSVDGQDYVLQGTPTTGGDYSFSIQATNGSETATCRYCLHIEDGSFAPWKVLADDPATFPYGDALTDELHFNDETGPLYPSSPSEPFDNRPHPCGLFSSALVDGKIYVCGGFADFNVYNLSKEEYYSENRQSHFSIYDPAADHWDSAYWKDWSPLGIVNGYPANGQPTGFNNPGSTISMTGGSNKPQTQWGTYTGAHQAWSYDRDNDGTEEFFIFGGYPVWDGTAGVYDPDTNEWTATTMRPLGTFYEGSCKRKDNLVYMVKGSSFMIYDILTDSWTIKDDLASGLEMDDQGGEIIGNEMILCGGSGANDWKRTVIYDIGTDSWSTSPAWNMPVGVELPTTCVYDGKLYVFGGNVQTSTWNEDEKIREGTNVIQVFDPATRTWEVLPFTTPYDLTGGGAEVIGDSIYLVYGHNYFWQKNDLMGRTWTRTSLNRLFRLDLPVGPSVEITSIVRNASGNAEITWTSQATETYTVQSAAGPYLGGSTVWTVEVSGVAGQPGTTSWEDTSSGSSTSKFYRVILE